MSAAFPSIGTRYLLPSGNHVEVERKGAKDDNALMCHYCHPDGSTRGIPAVRCEVTLQLSFVLKHGIRIN